MIVVPSRNKFFLTNVIYLYDGENLENIPPCDIIDFREALRKPNCKYSDFYTLTTDLTQSEDQLFNLIESGCRYEIRRAKDKDLIKTSFVIGDEISREMIVKFTQFYNEFADSKGLNHCDEKLMGFAYKSKNLALSFAVDENQESIIVAHAYFISDKQARLWYSCSHFRGGDGQYRNLVGRANRFLHWQDLIRLKNLGVCLLDWGGAGKHDAVANISKFKRSFGGVDATFYNYRLPVTFKGRIINLVKKILRR